ncbi:putative trans-2-enoyl-CoA reductase, partial [Aphelenchoides avenae]
RLRRQRAEEGRPGHSPKRGHRRHVVHTRDLRDQEALQVELGYSDAYRCELSHQPRLCVSTSEGLRKAEARRRRTSERSQFGRRSLCDT